MLLARLLPTFTTGRLSSKSGFATYRRIRRQLLRSLPPPLIDDFTLPPSPSPATSSPVQRYTSRDSFMLFDMMASVRDMFMLVLLFILLGHASIQVMFNLVRGFIMIYILVLI